MQIVIDIPEEIYESQRYAQYFGAWSVVLQKHFENGTPIPDNATNGDVLDKLFPNLTYGTNREHYHVWSNDGKITMNIHQDFWNTPYQRGGK